MPFRELDLLDIDPFDLLADEELFTVERSELRTAASAPRPARGRRGLRTYGRKARPVTAHLPGQHSQQSHGNSVSSPDALDGIGILDADEYATSYGDAQDDAGVDLDERSLTARYFTSGDAHVVLDLEDGKAQVLEEMEPESMRQLAYDLEELLAIDVDDFETSSSSEIVADVDSPKHDFYLARDAVGDIRLHPGGDEADYLELSAEQAQEFANALLDVADSYDEYFDGVLEVEAKAVRPVVAHGNHDQSTHGRRKSLKVDAPEPAHKKAAPKAKTTPEPKAPAKKAAPKAKPEVEAPKAPARKRANALRDSLASARNVADVSSVAQAEARRITGRDTTFDFTGSSLGIAREHAEGVLRGFERYPTTRLAAVRVEKLRSGVTAKVETRREGVVMLFGAEDSADARRYRDYARMEKKYKMKATGSPMGTALHEFGHVVANQYQANSQMRRAAVRNTDYLGQSDVSTHVRSELSAYATENEYELAAEAFADAMVNGEKASMLTHWVVAALDDAVKGVEGAS